MTTKTKSRKATSSRSGTSKPAWKVIKKFAIPETDIYTQAYTAYGNCDDWVYLIKGNVNYDWPDPTKVRMNLRVNLKTGEEEILDLPECTHYHFEGRIYSTDHEWIKSRPHSRFFIDGMIVYKELISEALDRTLFREFGQWLLYVRKPILQESNLAVSMSTDFQNWSRLIDCEVELGEHERVYSFGIFRLNDELYGIGNLLGLTDYSMKPVLYKGESYFKWSKVCEMKFSKMFQSFGQIVIRDEEVLLTTIEVDREHTTAANARKVKEFPYFSRIMTCSIEDFKRIYLKW